MARSDLQSFVNGGGSAGESARSFNWSGHSIGKPTDWPQSFTTSLNLTLNTKFPAVLCWSKSQFCFYNDAFRHFLGNEFEKNTWASSLYDFEPAIIHLLAANVERVMKSGEALLV